MKTDVKFLIVLDGLALVIFLCSIIGGMATTSTWLLVIWVIIALMSHIWVYELTEKKRRSVAVIHPESMYNGRRVCDLSEEERTAFIEEFKRKFSVGAVVIEEFDENVDHEEIEL